MKTITYNPETHVLVPIEPSEDMFRSMTDGFISINGDNRSQFNSGYYSMIAAAPQPEPVESEPVAEHELQDIRCECCGYMTYHREHIGCIRSSTPQPDRTAELEAALREAKSALLLTQEGSEFAACLPDEWSYAADKDNEQIKEALAKINEVLKS